MKKALFVFVFACALASAACGGIMIYPKYVELGDDARSAEMTLINPSEDETVRYRIALKYLRQKPDGSYEEVAETDALSGVDLLRYSPRGVTLGPKQSQTVKLLRRVPAGTPAGQYAAYISFTQVPPQPVRESLREKPSDSLQIRLTPVPSFNIPVLVTVGPAPEAQAALEWLGAEPGGVRVRLRRAAACSGAACALLRGDVSVWQAGRMLGVVKGKYILPGAEYIDVLVPLSTPLVGGKTEVLFTEHNENPAVWTDRVLTRAAGAV